MRAAWAAIAIAGLACGFAARGALSSPVVSPIVISIPAAPAVAQPERVEIVHRVEQVAAPSAPAASATAPQPPPEQTWSDRLAAVDAEPRNAVWAHEHERAIAQVLAGRELKAKVRDVSCKTRHCKVSFEWPDRDAALAELAAVVETPPPGLYECGRSMTLPDADPRSATYLADAVFECP